jgi:hypothetical protein
MGVVRVEYMWCAATGSRLPAWRSAGGECEAARAHDLSLLRTVFPRQQLHKPPDDGVRLMSRGPLLICLAGEGKAAGEGSHLRAVDFVVLRDGGGAVASCHPRGAVDLASCHSRWAQAARRWGEIHEPWAFVNLPRG